MNYYQQTQDLLKQESLRKD